MTSVDGLNQDGEGLEVKCHNCGMELPDGVKFCHECGEKQGRAIEAILSDQEIVEIAAG